MHMPQTIGLETATRLLGFALEAGSLRHAPEPLGPGAAEPPVRVWQQGSQGTRLNPLRPSAGQRPIRLEKEGLGGTRLKPLGLMLPS